MTFNSRNTRWTSPPARIDPSTRDLLPDDLKIYKYIPFEVEDTSVPPVEHDYVTGLTTRLHPSFTDVYQGEIREVTYYGSASQDPTTGIVTYSDPIVRENFVYYRDSVGFARQRVQTITWIKIDESDHGTTKTRLKIYESFESLVEGKRRRSHLTDRMAMELSQWLAVTQTHLPTTQERLQLGRDFLRTHHDSFDLFVEVSDHQIVYDVRNDAIPDNSWLDDTWDGVITCREWIDTQINIWGLP